MFHVNELEFDQLMASLSYFGESSNALTVDQDKWINLPSNVRQAAAAEAAAIKEQAVAPVPSKPIPRVGRNDQCPCGSGKKYKKCHGSPQDHERAGATGGSPPPGRAAGKPAP